MGGKTVGPLAGVPVGIKDLVYTKGIRTTSGSIIYKDYVPTEDDVVVERLKAAGAVIIGKTNVPELGYSGASYNMIFPPTNNPWNTERTAGGSSASSGLRSRQASAQWRSAATVADPSESQRRSTGCSASKARWVASRSIPAPRRDRAWRLRLGIDRTHRAAHPHSRRRRVDDERDRVRAGRSGSPNHPQQRQLDGGDQGRHQGARVA